MCVCVCVCVCKMLFNLLVNKQNSRDINFSREHEVDISSYYIPKVRREK